MDPRTYCKQGIARLSAKRARRRTHLDGAQRIVVLAYFIRQDPSAADFAAELQLLAASAERQGRCSLAQAARAVLADWEAEAAGGDYRTAMR